eukprot:EG_transcript_28462
MFDRREQPCWSQAIAVGLIVGCGFFSLSSFSVNGSVANWVQTAPAVSQSTSIPVPLTARSVRMRSRQLNERPTSRRQAANDVMVHPETPSISVSKWWSVAILGAAALLPVVAMRRFASRRGDEVLSHTAAASVWSMASSGERTTAIQFVRGTDELTIPDVKLSRSKDGAAGRAVFRFQKPNIFEISSDIGQISGLYLIDEEGTLSSLQVTAKFINGSPVSIEATYI